MPLPGPSDRGRPFWARDSMDPGPTHQKPQNGEALRVALLEIVAQPASPLEELRELQATFRAVVVVTPGQREQVASRLASRSSGSPSNILRLVGTTSAMTCRRSSIKSSISSGSRVSGKLVAIQLTKSG